MLRPDTVHAMLGMAAKPLQVLAFGQAGLVK